MAKTVVVKIGSKVLANDAGDLDARSVKRVRRQLAKLQQRCNVVVLVSGAVQFGKKLFANKQAAAAWGQVRLMQAFGNVGQMLLCKNDLKEVLVRKSLLKTIEDFWQQGLVVLINENDVVEMNSFGGNDFLALEMARLVDAKEIVLMSNVDGLLDKQKQVVGMVRSVNQDIWDLVDDQNASGVGGMKAKIEVAKMCLQEGRKLTITNGRTEGTVFV